LPQPQLFANVSGVNLTRIELRYANAAGLADALGVAPPQTGATSATHHDVTLSARLEHAIGGTMIHVTIANRGDQPIRLDVATFEVATGIAPTAPTRFFKHGYQSWSSSAAVDLSDASQSHPRDSAHFLTRMSHQSESTRTAEFPEMLTSELFTIVESPSLSERIMVGFVGAKSALTTITVPAPEKIIASAILDGVTLAPRTDRELDPLFIVADNQSAARLAARWADATGRWMHARVSAPFQRGWCSWYHYFHAITEDSLRANIKSLIAMRSEFPLELIQLDDGFQSALGDWDTTNAKFPSGLRKIAHEIRAAGFKAGLWTAPFLAARDSRLMRDHPEWFITHEQTGEPMRAGHNTNWTASDDPYAYALDPSNPGFRAHLERLFEKLTRDFGYSYLKLDFLYAAAAPGRRHNPNMTRGETLRRGLEAIRAGSGDDAFILGCGCPLGQAVGIVDGMRIGPDVSPFWGSGTADPSTVYALDAIIARSFMHRRLWLNDPDCLMLRARETRLTADERAALAAVIGASGGMLLISDDMALLGKEEGELFRTIAKISAKIDSNATQEPILALDLMTAGDVRGMVNKNPQGAITMLLNRGDSVAQVQTSDLNLAEGEATALDLATGERRAVFDRIDLAPHSARVIRVRK
jgi:alpha-galactosidase